MQITREYLESHIASLTNQAEEAKTTLLNANGALALAYHLLAQIDAKEPENAQQDASPAPVH
jgi:hypothetical protein